MSAIAGIIGLGKRRHAIQDELRAMLAAMAISDADPLQMVASPDNGFAVGKLLYGPDAGEAAGFDQPLEPKLLLVGEVYDLAGSENSAKYILDRYSRLGVPAFLKDLNGSFCATIVDPQDRSVLLMTDHMNSVPIYAVQHEGVLYFANEIKGLMALPHLPCRLDMTMVLMTLTSGQWLNLHTLFEGVEMMGCATVWQSHNATITRTKVWRYDIRDDASDKGREYYVQETSRLLEQAVKRQMRCGNPSISLSGGLDSRAIIGFMEVPSLAHAITFTHLDAAYQHSMGDTAIAGRLAALLGARHTVIKFYPNLVLDTIQASVFESDGAACFLMQHVWDSVRSEGGSNYVLTGDECISGAAAPITEGHILECMMVRRLAEEPGLLPYLNPSRLSEFMELSDSACRIRMEGLSGRPTNNQLDELTHRQQLIQHHNPLRRMSARQAVLVRRPLLDLPFMDFLKTVPWKHRNGKTIVREALKRRNRALYHIPRARVIERPDYGPILAALERDGGRISSFVFNDNPFFEEIFNVRAVRELVGEVALIKPESRPRAIWNVTQFIPAQARRWMTAHARRYLGIHARHQTSPTALLLQVLKVAAALRHVSRRCAGAKRQWTRE